VSELPSQEGFIDPNARLLASVIPPPPPSFWQRVKRAVREGRIDLRSIGSWTRSREGRSCFLVALAAAALAVVLHRSEPTSFARTASAISRETRSESALVAKSESVRPALRPALRPLADVPPPARSAPELARSANSANTERAHGADGERAEPAKQSSERNPSASASRTKSKREAQARRSARGDRHASAAKKSRKKIEKRKAKRKSVARASARSRRAKSKPTKASTPLRAWIASRSRDD
jgi:hypothetical protein